VNVDEIASSNGGRKRRELKDSYFDGYEYKGYRVKTKLVIEGRKRYKPLRLSKSVEVYDAFKGLKDTDREKFYSILLDKKNKVIGVDMVSQGSGNSSPVNPAEVYKAALLASASSVIFVHSHPSGEFEPSLDDRGLTALLKKAGELMGVEVLDHVIIGRDGYYSFADKRDL
jgi:DNA repair protein RadC